MLFKDAEQLVDILLRRREWKQIAKKLQRLRALMSIQIDLQRCCAALDTLISRAGDRMGAPEGDITQEESLIDGALANFLIITYAKSTDVSSPRGKFDPRRYYSSDQMKFHDELISLRNQAVAHFGGGQHRDGSWSEDRLVIADDGANGIRLDISCKRYNYKAVVIAELRAILPRALEGIKGEIADLREKLSVEIASTPELRLLIPELSPGYPSTGEIKFRRRALKLDQQNNPVDEIPLEDFGLF